MKLLEVGVENLEERDFLARHAGMGPGTGDYHPRTYLVYDSKGECMCTASNIEFAYMVLRFIESKDPDLQWVRFGLVPVVPIITSMFPSLNFAKGIIQFTDRGPGSPKQGLQDRHLRSEFTFRFKDKDYTIAGLVNLLATEEVPRAFFLEWHKKEKPLE